jgi:FRG domain-containing protein
MSWPELRVTNWAMFVAAISQLHVAVPPGATYTFRGQPNTAYSLRPSLQRMTSKLTRAEALRIEKIVLAEFQSQAHLLLQPAWLPDYRDMIAWWTLMQHHGAPTRVLDWTKSPYVAAYFAVESQPDQDGAVWYFHANRLDVRLRESGQPTMDDAVKDLNGFFASENDRPCCYLFQRKQKIERMVTQQGGFTVSPDVIADHADIIEKAIVENDAKEWFRKMVIPAELKPEFLLQLHRLNVNGIALFPGIDGLGRSMKELASLQAQAVLSSPESKGS